VCPLYRFNRCFTFHSDKSKWDVSVPTDVIFTSLVAGSLKLMSDPQPAEFASCGILFSNRTIACYGTLQWPLPKGPVGAPIEGIWSSGQRMCAAYHGELFCWDDDVRTQFFSGFLSAEYRHHVNVTYDGGYDHPFCSLEGFAACRTLVYAFQQHQRVATTFHVTGAEAYQADMVIEFDATTVIDQGFKRAMITHNGNGTAAMIANGRPIRFGATIQSAHYVRLVGLRFVNTIGVTTQGDPGAALRVQGSNFLDLVDCVFEDNTAEGIDGSGGGLGATASNISCTRCWFVNNNATSRGGAAFLDSSSLTCYYCTIMDNTANDGGGFHVQGRGGTINCDSCHFMSNFAKSRGGGLLAMREANVWLMNTDLYSNTALSEGGAVALYQDIEATVINCQFHDNYCELNGGALSVVSSAAQVTLCSFTANYVSHFCV
jgi:hypothetical protein